MDFDQSFVIEGHNNSFCVTVGFQIVLYNLTKYCCFKFAIYTAEILHCPPKIHKEILEIIIGFSQETYRLFRNTHKKHTDYCKILPRCSTDTFRKLASDVHNHCQETYSWPILHTAFKNSYYVYTRTLTFQITTMYCVMN